MRVKRGVVKHAKSKKIRQATKGMGHTRRASVRKGNEAIIKALSYGYRDRRNKKRYLRSLWIIRINAALEQNGISYSQFIGQTKTAGITIDRKILAELAVSEPKAFSAIVAAAKK